MAFELSDFVSNSTWEKLENLRKIDLLQLVDHYEIHLPLHFSKLKADDLKNIVIDYLGNQGILDVDYDLESSVKKGPPFDRSPDDSFEGYLGKVSGLSLSFHSLSPAQSNVKQYKVAEDVS